MSRTLTHNQTYATPQEALAHYGVKGMRWGHRKADPLQGVSRKTSKEASKDAEEFARAKMFYGKGAGTRRKLIKAQVEAKAKKDPAYKKAFEHHLERQDLGKHATKARGERRRKDTRETTTKTVKGAHRQLTGGFGPVTLGAAALAAGVVVAKQNNVDQILKDSATTKYRDAKQRRQNKSDVDKLLKDLGLA